MTRFSVPSQRRQHGVTLIELMVAMLIGLLVAGGIVSLFISTSSSNRAQSQLATLQEEGRFAISQITTDLRMANGFYCSNMGGAANTLSNGLSLDALLRAPQVYLSGSGLTAALHDVTTKFGATSGNTYPDAPSAAYYMPAFLSMRGYDCTTKACTPVDPSVIGIPAMAASANSRVPGADVLTVRYLDASRGWGLSDSQLTVSANAVSAITVAPTTANGEAAASTFSGGPVMLADCNGSQIFAASRSGNTFTPATTGNFAGTTVSVPSGLVPRLFDLQTDFQTVTYYLKEVSDNNGHLTGALVRRLNGPDGTVSGTTDLELVRGIERLDFRYGVMDSTGNTRFYTASDLDKLSGSNCPSSSPSPLSSADPGCAWRSVQSIEVHLLMDGQQPLYTLSANEMAYTYWGDSGDTVATPSAPSAHAIKPTDQGFDEHLLRREFSALISVRNYNP